MVREGEGRAIACVVRYQKRERVRRSIGVAVREVCRANMVMRRAEAREPRTRGWKVVTG